MTTTSDGSEPPSLSSSAGQSELPPEVVLRTVQPVRSAPLRWILRWLPWIGLVIALVVLVPGSPVEAGGPQLFGTGVITAAAVLFAFQGLLGRVPEALEALWRRELILAKREAFTQDHKVAQDSDHNAHSDDELARHYMAYLKDFGNQINNGIGQFATVILFCLLVNSWIPFLSLNYLGNLIRGKIGLVALAELVIDIVLACLVGLMAWRLLIIGYRIWRLPADFDLKVQFEHPDQCGGLEPLGNLCLWNAFIVSLPAIFFGCWLLIARSSPSNPPSPYETMGWCEIVRISQPNSPEWWQASIRCSAIGYSNLYAKLVLTLVPFSVLGFVLPLWNVHRVMTAKRRELLIRLDKLVKNISDEWSDAVEGISRSKSEDSDEKFKRLELMKQIYEKQKRVPVWPINISILLKFISTQAVPLLSLTSIGPEIIKVASALIGLLPSEPSK